MLSDLSGHIGELSQDNRILFAILKKLSADPADQAGTQLAQQQLRRTLLVNMTASYQASASTPAMHHPLRGTLRCVQNRISGSQRH